MTLPRRQQRTIAKPVSITGFGFWTGPDVNVRLRPAPSDTGLVFVRQDVIPPRRIPARAEYRVESLRRTSLGRGEVRVEMVEHILAALAGLRVDNCEIWVDAAEMPCGDGSSKDVVEAILQAGVVEQNTLRDELTIMRPIRVGDDQCWIEARPAHQRGLHLCYDLDFGTGHTIGRQQLQVTLDPDVFCYQLATARTFIMKGEADMMRANGIGLRTTYQNLLVFDDHGPIENQLRFPDECVRHKTLDLVGDLALANCDIHGEIHAYRSGHRLNAELVWRLLESHAVSRIFRYSA